MFHTLEVPTFPNLLVWISRLLLVSLANTKPFQVNTEHFLGGNRNCKINFKILSGERKTFQGGGGGCSNKLTVFKILRCFSRLGLSAPPSPSACGNRSVIDCSLSPTYFVNICLDIPVYTYSTRLFKLQQLYLVK